MEGMTTILFIVHIIVAFLLLGIIMIQKSGEDSLSGIGGGSGGNMSMLSSKATANILTKGTMILTIVFMLNCLVLASMVSRSHGNKGSLIEKRLDSIEKVQKDVETKLPEAK